MSVHLEHNSWGAVNLDSGAPQFYGIRISGGEAQGSGFGGTARVILIHSGVGGVPFPGPLEPALQRVTAAL